MNSPYKIEYTVTKMKDGGGRITVYLACPHEFTKDLGLQAIDPNYEGIFGAREYYKKCGARKPEC